jgi:hypothetical protein
VLELEEAEGARCVHLPRRRIPDGFLEAELYAGPLEAATSVEGTASAVPFFGRYFVERQGTHHLRELHKAGSIHIDRTEKVKSVNQHYYRLINPLFYSDEEMQALSEDERMEVIRVVLDRVMRGQVGVSLLSYHLRKLTEVGALVRVRQEPVRGAVQTFYALADDD